MISCDGGQFSITFLHSFLYSKGLNRGSRCYGYAMIQRVRELSEGEMQWADGMLYPVLHRLEREGLIESAWEAAETGRKRKYYHLREEGQAALKVERTQWQAVHGTLWRLWENQRCFT